MLVAGTVPWSLCILQENRCTEGGVGMVTFMHLHTCEMLRNCWAGVGIVTFMRLHTCEMRRNRWAGVGMMTFMHLHTCEMLRTQNWGSLALGKHGRSKLAKLEKKPLVSRFGKQTLFVVQHGIT